VQNLLPHDNHDPVQPDLVRCGFPIEPRDHLRRAPPVPVEAQAGELVEFHVGHEQRMAKPQRRAPAHNPNDGRLVLVHHVLRGRALHLFDVHEPHIVPLAEDPLVPGLNALVKHFRHALELLAERADAALGPQRAPAAALVLVQPQHATRCVWGLCMHMLHVFILSHT
jgi:hypothetical protein